MGIWDDVEECYSRAAEYYNGEGRYTAAADALAKGARALEEKRPEVGDVGQKLVQSNGECLNSLLLAGEVGDATLLELALDCLKWVMWQSG